MRKISFQITLIILGLFGLSLVHAQSPFLDSLKNELNHNSGVERLNTLWKLGLNLNYSDNEQAQKYLDEGLEVLATIDTFPELKKQLTISKFQSVRNWGNFSKKNYYDAFSGSLKLDSLTDILLELGEREWGYKYKGDVGTIRGAIFDTQKQYKKASYEFHNSLQAYITLNDTSALAWGYQSVGFALINVDSLDEALQYFFKADTIIRKFENKDRDIVQNNLNIGLCYLKKEDWEQAANVFQSSLPLAEKVNERRTPFLKGQYAKALFKLGKIEKAFQYATEAREGQKKDSPNYKAMLKTLAEIEEARNNSESALAFQKEFNEINEEEDVQEFSEELIALQTEYANQLNPPVTSNNYWWALIPIGILFGIMIWYLNKPKVIEHQPLEIAWKNELEETQIEDPFLERFVNKVQENLENDNLSVESIADEFKLSRVQLFKKIKASTGISPSQVIRKIRLETAEKLLIENNTTVSEVAYKVGFTNPNSFSRSFKDHFGKPPSEYLGKVS